MRLMNTSWGIGCAVATAAALSLATSARAQYLLIGNSATGSTSGVTGVQSIMLFDANDGHLIDANFIPQASSPYTFSNPRSAIQVGNEIWVADGGSIFCFTATYDPNNNPHPTYIRTISGTVSSLIRSLTTVGNNVYVLQTPSNVITNLQPNGSFVASFPVVGTIPGSVTNFNGQLLTADISTGHFGICNTDGTGAAIYGNSSNAKGQVNVFPTGSAGAQEIWVAGSTGLATSGIFRYDSTGNNEQYYPCGIGMAGIYRLGSGEIIFTDTPNAGVSAGEIKKFDPSVPVVKEVQSLTITGTTGTYSLTYNGQTTATMTYGTSSVQTALGNLTLVGSGNVVTCCGTLGSGGVTTLTATSQVSMGTSLLVPHVLSGDLVASVSEVTHGSGAFTTLYSPTTAGTGIVPGFINPFSPVAPGPTNPYGAGSVTLTAGQAGVLAGTSTLITVTATPGTTPTSSALAVSANLSGFGGSATQAFTNTTGNTFTYTLNIPASQPGGNYNIPLAVTDPEMRTGGGSLLFTVIAAPPANYFAETEPNDTGKAQAQAVQLATTPTAGAYLGVWGTSTGSSLVSGSGLTTADNYRLTVPSAPLGIYLNSMTITGGTDIGTSNVGHTGIIRGLNQGGGAIGSTDTAVETSVLNAGTTPPNRTVYWYGFGKQEQFYYRVTGLATTPAEYIATFYSQPVTPTLLATNPAPGALTFTRPGTNPNATAIMLYDSNLNPITSGGFNAGVQGLTTGSYTSPALATGGPYYACVAMTSLSNNLPTSGASTAAMDFPNILVNGASTFASNNTLDIVMTDSASNAVTLSGTRTQTFQGLWYKFYVGTPTTPVVNGSASPSPVIAGPAGGSTQLTATVSAGSNPPSTGLTVSANLNALGGTTMQAFTDNGDGTFGYTLSVPASQPAGLYSIPVTVTDAQARQGSGTISLRVLPAPPPGFVVEFEANDNRFAATPAPIAPGQGVYGFTTGSFSANFGDPDSPDYFTLELPPMAQGIYRNRMVITTSGTPGHTGSLIGRNQVSGSIDYNSSATFQSSTDTTTPPRFNQWYGFGRGEQMDYRITGSQLTTSEYLSTLETVTVSPVVVPGSIASGSVTINRGTGNTTTLDMWIYDSNLMPIGNAGNEGNSTLTRSLNAGTYYLAVSDVNTANDQASPTDSAARSGPVLGTDAIANSSAASNLNMNVAFNHAGGSLAATGSKAGPFDVVWYQITVADDAAAGACCAADGSCAGSHSGTCTGVFQGPGSVCSPNPCPPPPSGVCCRGATCNASVSIANCGTSGALAGSTFVTTASTCNVASTTTPCCYADYNKVNGITVQDIFDFLNSWFSGSHFAIVGGDGVTGTLSVQNIFDFLNAWFAGC
jgi:hypothetical protein